MSDSCNSLPLSSSLVPRNSSSPPRLPYRKVTTGHMLLRLGNTRMSSMRYTSNKKIEEKMIDDFTETNLGKVKEKRERILSSLLFLSTSKLFSLSSMRNITRRDIGSLSEGVKGQNALDTFLKFYYLKYQDNIDFDSPRKLWVAILLFEKWKISQAIFYRILSDAIMVSLPLAFRELSATLKKEEIDFSYGLMIIILIPMLLLIQDLLRQHSEMSISKVKARVGQALRSFLYERMLNSDYTFLSMSEPNFLSRLIFFELDHFLDFIHIVPSLISGPLALSLSGVLVIMRLNQYMQFWFIFFATSIQIVVVIFLLNLFNKKVTDSRDRYSGIQSKQATHVQELISSISQIKVNLYENYFEKRLIALRIEANKALSSMHKAYGIVEFILVMTPFLFSCVIVTTYNQFGPTKVQTTQIFTVISMMVAVAVPLRSFSESLKTLNMYQVAYKCTSSFFLHVQEAKERTNISDEVCTAKGEIRMNRATFSADAGASVRKINNVFESADGGKEKASKISSEFTLVRSRKNQKTSVVPTLELSRFPTSTRKIVLRDLSFSITPGEKICVVGKEGDAKLPYFLSLLGELKLEEGDAFTTGKIAFLDMDNQKFLKATIRENIILGDEFVLERFIAICKAVGLSFESYPGRELTEIVEGQRNLLQADIKKILLARLLYKDTDIALINKYFDQLSKDQQEVLFKKIVRGFLKDKTVIYTSNINLLMKQSDRIFVFNNSKLEEIDTYDRLISNRRSLLYRIVMTDSSGGSNFLGKILEGLRIYPNETLKHEIDVLSKSARVSRISKSITPPYRSEINISKKLDSKQKLAKSYDLWLNKTLDKFRGKTLREEEEFVLDNVIKSIKTLLLVNGTGRMVLVFITFLATDIALVAIQFWMAFWGDNLLNLSYDTNYTIFLIIVATVCVLVLAREVIFSKILLKNLGTNYKKCIREVLKAEKEWFDQNPANRIVYLLTKDQMVVDNDLVRSFFTLIDTCLITLIIVITLNIFYFGLMLLLTIAISVPLYYINRKFGVVSQQLLAFTNKSRAELIDVYLETFDNLTMLRVNGKGDYFRKNFFKKTDSFQIAHTCLYNNSMRWLNMRISLLSVLMIVIVTGMPYISKLLMSDIYLKSNWQLTYSLGTAPFLLANIVNFSRFYPQTTLHLLSAQRIFKYIFDLTKDPNKNSMNISHRKVEKDAGMILKSLAAKINMKKKVNVSNTFAVLNHPPKVELSKFMSNKDGDFTPKEALEKQKIDLPKEGEKKPRKQSMTHINILTAFTKTLQPKVEFKFDKKKNMFKVGVRPLILMKNVCFSTPNSKILNNINLKIFEAEKVAVVDPENYGRQSLLNVMLLLDKIDSNPNSVFELLGRNVEFASVHDLRKEICFLSQYPRMFTGTVKENIDPDNNFTDSEIVRTLHFLKIFEALQKFTGFTKSDEIAISLQQKEGKIEVIELELEEMFKKEKLAQKLANKKRNKSIFNIEPAMLNRMKTIEMINFSPQKIEESELDESNNEIEVPNNFKVLEDQLADRMDNFFQEQIDDLMPIPERARRIDPRLQDFDNNYEFHNVNFPEEEKIVRLFMKMDVGKNGKNLNETLLKICQLTKLFLRRPRLILLDEDALVFPDFDSSFYFSSLFEVFKESGIISLSKNYRNLHQYSIVYVMKGGEIIEKGKPLELVDDINSKLYQILANDDIRTVRQLENRIEKNREKFLEFLQHNLFDIQNNQQQEIQSKDNNHGDEDLQTRLRLHSSMSNEGPDKARELSKIIEYPELSKDVGEFSQDSSQTDQFNEHNTVTRKIGSKEGVMLLVSDLNEEIAPRRFEIHSVYPRSTPNSRSQLIRNSSGLHSLGSTPKLLMRRDSKESVALSKLSADLNNYSELSKQYSIENSDDIPNENRELVKCQSNHIIN